MLGVSMAVARAAAAAAELPLYAYLGGAGATRLPVPMMNILNGGKHADNSVDFQEFMVMPIGAPTFAEALRYGAETFHALEKHPEEQGLRDVRRRRGRLCAQPEEQRGGVRIDRRGDRAAGYRPGRDIAIALDPAASSFYRGRRLPADQIGMGARRARK